MTSSTRARKTYTPLFSPSGFWPLLGCFCWAPDAPPCCVCVGAGGGAGGVELGGGAVVGAAWAQPPRLRQSTSSGKIRYLLRRRIVSRFGIDVQRWKPFWRIQLDLYFMPFAIVHWFGWTVAQHILVAQLYAYFGSYV